MRSLRNAIGTMMNAAAAMVADAQNLVPMRLRTMMWSRCSALSDSTPQASWRGVEG